jgi:hypothetical protein
VKKERWHEGHLLCGGKRATARATSRDFLNWSDFTMMTYSDTQSTTPSQHLYTNQTQSRHSVIRQLRWKVG